MIDGMEDVVEAAEVIDLQRRLPGVLGEVQKMEEALINRVFHSISNKTLTEGQAYYAWLELIGYRQLARRLKTKVAVGLKTVAKVHNGALGAPEGGK